MPIFEFKCKNCGAAFEKLVFSSSRDKPVKCEKCNSEETEKLMSTFAASGAGTGEGCSSSGGFT